MNRGKAMSHQPKWAGIALVAFLLSGCGLCQGESRGTRSATGSAEFKRSDSQPPTEQRPDALRKPAQSGGTTPGNAFSQFIDNKSDSWEGPRVYMPTSTGTH